MSKYFDSVTPVRVSLKLTYQIWTPRSTHDATTRLISGEREPSPGDEKRSLS